MEKLNLPGYIKPDLFNIKYKHNKSGDDIIEAIILAYDLEDAIGGFYDKISKDDINTIISITNLSVNTEFMYTKTGYDNLIGKDWYIYDMKIDKQIIKDFEYPKQCIIGEDLNKHIEYVEKDNIKTEFNKYLDKLRSNIKISIDGYCSKKIEEPTLNGEEFYYCRAMDSESFKPILHIKKVVENKESGRLIDKYYSIDMSDYLDDKKFTSTNYVDFRTEILSLAKEIETSLVANWTPLYSFYIFS